MAKSNKKFINAIYFYFTLVVSISLFLLSIIFSVFIYKVVPEQIYKANSETLTTISNSIDLSINNIENLSSQLAIDPDVLNFIDKPISSEYFNAKTLLDKIENLKVTTPLVDSIYIYYAQNNNLIATSIGAIDAKLFFDYDFIKQMDFNESTKWYFNRNSDSEKNAVFSYVKYLPIGSMYKDAAIIFNIRYEKFKESLISDKNNIEDILIFDSQGNSILQGQNSYNNLLYEEGMAFPDFKGYKRKRIDNNSYLISYTKGENTWRYAMLTTTNSLYNSLIVLSIILLAGFIFIIVIDLLFMFKFSNKLYKPIDNIVNLLNGTLNENYSMLPHAYEEFSLIHTGLSNIIEDYKLLAQTAHENQTYAETRIMLGLLHGNIDMAMVSDSNIKSTLSRYKFFVVLTIEMDDYDALIEETDDGAVQNLQNSIILSAEEIFFKNNIEYFKVIKTFKYQLSILVCSNDSKFSMHSIFRLATDLTQNVNDLLNESISIGISNPSGNINDIHKLYEQSSSSIQYRMLQGRGSVIYYENVSLSDSKLFLYPQKQEQEIISNIKALNHDNLKLSISQFSSAITAYKRIENQQVSYIFSQLLSSILKTVYEPGCNVSSIVDTFEIYRKLNKCKFLNEIENLLYEVCGDVIDYIKEFQNNKYTNIINIAVNFIEENYMNPQLNIDMISKKVYLSNNYVERMFKNEKGETILEFIQKLRVEKAKKYLANLNLTIDAISSKTGFNSSRSFIRVFKKYEGITPGEFRRVHITLI